MPVKDWSLYPKDWKEIRARIEERAHGFCERCGVPNHSLCIRIRGGEYVPIAETDQATAVRHGYKVVRIVCTTAHLNHDVADNRDENLRFLCQRCHLRHDAKHHAQNAAATRARKKYASQPVLF